MPMPKDAERRLLIITNISTLGDFAELCVMRDAMTAPNVIVPIAISEKPKK